jgi:predicted HNH restriction endonuclease
MSRIYQEVLHSRRWKALKWRRILLAGFKCEDCGLELADKRPRRAMDLFHLHHESYRNLGNETLEDVRVLCPACHFKPERHPWRRD